MRMVNRRPPAQVTFGPRRQVRSTGVNAGFRAADPLAANRAIHREGALRIQLQAPPRAAPVMPAAAAAVEGSPAAAVVARMAGAVVAVEAATAEKEIWLFKLLGPG